MRQRKNQPISNQKLRAARLAHCWSLATAAERAQVSIEAYSRWEYGQQQPRLSSLELLCQGFGQSPQELGFGHLVKLSLGQETPSVEPNGSQDAALPQALSEAPRTPQREGTRSQGLFIPQESSLSFGELQERVERVLRRFLDVEQVSRRTLITLLMSVPAAAFAVALPGEAPLLHDDEIISLAAVNVPLAWRLYFAGGLEEVREILPLYLTKLSAMAEHPSRYQQRAAGLTSQAHQLGYLLGLQGQNYGQAMDHARKAFQYAQVADDNNLRLASLVRQGNLFHVMKRPMQTLVKYQEALQYRDQASPLLLGQAYVGLAEAYAKTGQKNEALNFQGLAQDTFPADPQEDLHFAYTHFNRFTLTNFEGLMYIHLGQPQQAWDAFAAVEKNIPSALVPQKVELLIRQTLALVTLGDLPQSCDHLELATMAALRLGSDLRYHEAAEIYDQMLLKWPTEQRVKRLEELFHQ